jgi:hypothetical protein
VADGRHDHARVVRITSSSSSSSGTTPLPPHILTLMLIVRAFIDHAITIAVWTRFSFHGASSVLFQSGISTLIH